MNLNYAALAALQIVFNLLMAYARSFAQHDRKQRLHCLPIKAIARWNTDENRNYLNSEHSTLLLFPRSIDFHRSAGNPIPPRAEDYFSVILLSFPRTIFIKISQFLCGYAERPAAGPKIW